MSATSRRLLALPLALGTLLAAPLAANAAMGGANALTTSLRPDLRTATVQSTNAVDDTTTVRVCFSKGIASLPQAGLFELGTYANNGFAPGVVATSATRSTSNCADAVFPNSDAEQFTYVSVGGSDGTAPDSGSSAVSTNGFGNISDSTALVGSKTNNGTRGFGTGPDLVGIAANNAASTIDFTFDQVVAGVTAAVGVNAGAFVLNTGTGAEVPSLPGADNRSISSDGKTVRVNFPAGSVTDAVRAFVAEQAVEAKAGGYLNGLRSAARPGSGGFTDRPDLVAASLADDGSHVDFQFDQVLSATGPATAFRIQLAESTNSGLAGVPAIVGGANVGNTVRVPCTGCNGAELHELLISAGAVEGAVTGAGGDSTAGGLPVGGNAGAFATGFTIAPEALTVSFDNATSIVSVLFDQRWLIDDANAFKLIDDQGSQISAAAINVTGSGSPAAGRTTAQITFPAGTVTGARSLLIQPNGAFTAFAGNVAQAISPTAPAAKTAKKFRKAKVVRRAAKRR